MEIEKAAELGFCTGVRRAINILDRAGRELGPLSTLGPVVHNQQVMESLARRGISVAQGVDHIPGDIVAISSHGVSPQLVERLRERGLRIVDTTCPFVRRAQAAARRLASAGFFVILFGEGSHPEVEGVLGWAGGRGLATLDVPRLEGAQRRVGILSQTTQSFAGFTRFVADFLDSNLSTLSELRIINTICDATRKRQRSALELAKRVDLMLVVGGHDSANTHRLAEICTATGVDTHLIERAVEIDPLWLRDRHRIGVTAGASTPDQAVEEVMARLELVVQLKEA